MLICKGTLVLSKHLGTERLIVAMHMQKSQIVEYKMLTQIYKSLKRICSDYALNLYTPLHARWNQFASSHTIWRKLKCGTKLSGRHNLACQGLSIRLIILTINFVFKRSIWMKHTYCMDKLFKFNNRIFFFIKKIKNLEEQEKGKTQISGPTWNAGKFQSLILRYLTVFFFSVFLGILAL